jgi:hypothetical protein
VQEVVVDLLCLVYHEARNVRHAVKKGLVVGEPYKALTTLPNNPKELSRRLLNLG